MGIGGCITGSETQRTVLVVDDHAPTRLLCRVNLEAAGMQVDEAADGCGVLEQVRRRRPDVILLDIMMPGVSGWQVAADLAGDPSTNAIPIVFISARVGLNDRLRAFAAGAAGYITKPFDPLALAPAITSLLDRIDAGEHAHPGGRARLLAGRLDPLQHRLP